MDNIVNGLVFRICLFATQNRSFSPHCDQLESGLADMLSKLFNLMKVSDNSAFLHKISMPSLSMAMRKPLLLFHGRTLYSGH